VSLVLHNANNAQLRFHALGVFMVETTRHRHLLVQASRKRDSLVLIAKRGAN
jgi:hypothetical protein